MLQSQHRAARAQKHQRSIPAEKVRALAAQLLGTARSVPGIPGSAAPPRAPGKEQGEQLGEKGESEARMRAGGDCESGWVGEWMERWMERWAELPYLPRSRSTAPAPPPLARSGAEAAGSFIARAPPSGRAAQPGPARPHRAALGPPVIAGTR